MTKVAAGFLAAILMTALLLPTAAEEDRPKLVKPVNLVVNTKANEDDPHPVGNSLYYSCNAEGKYSIYLSTRRGPLDAWSKGQILENVATEVDDRSVFFLQEPTGFQYLFLATMRDKESKSFDIYAMQRLDSKKVFSALTGVQSVSTEADELHPWITTDRKSMYFSRKTKDGWRVFVVTRPGAVGPQFQGEPRLIEELPPGFHHASLTPNGQTMYLQGPLPEDRWGIFVSQKMGKTWSKPEEIVNLNHPDALTGDRSPAVTRDGLNLYFASDRPGGKGGMDLYVIPIAHLSTRK